MSSQQPDHTSSSAQLSWLAYPQAHRERPNTEVPVGPLVDDRARRRRHQRRQDDVASSSRTYQAQQYVHESRRHYNPHTTHLQPPSYSNDRHSSSSTDGEDVRGSMDQPRVLRSSFDPRTGQFSFQHDTQAHEYGRNILYSRSSDTDTRPMLNAPMHSGTRSKNPKNGTPSPPTSISNDSFMDLRSFRIPATMSKTRSMLECSMASDTNSDDMDYRTEKKLMYKEALMAGPVEVLDDEEKGQQRSDYHVRKYFLAVTFGIMFSLIAISYYNLVPLIILQGNFFAAPLLVLVPIMYFLGSFCIFVLVMSMVNVFLGPVRLLRKNNLYYSYHRTPIPIDARLPMVVVQMPVYKEDLDEVIVPTHKSVMKAVDYYQAAGGVVKYLICDDGLQLISEEAAAARMSFYAKNQISFVARPAKPFGGVRRGLFKKASNMNYTLRIGEMVKQKVKERPELTHQEALGEVWKELNSEFVAGGDITIPDDAIILLIDADTRVPEACILDTMGEFVSTPDLPYTQHFTQPFDEQKHNYWEEMISFFTEKIYFAGLMLTSAMGGYAPLVGHNAFLRWSMVKEVAFECPEEKFVKYWSEDTVSEDFDLFMRFASKNKFGRYVVFTGPEFQEGVSLSYIDEVIKFRKFTYGACEMVFHPFKDWIFKGPFTPLYKSYMLSKRINWSEKFTLTFYLSTYFAMAASFYLAVWEAVCTIIWPDFFDEYMVRGFDIMVTINFVFGLFATISSIFLLWRINAGNQKHQLTLFRIIWNEVKWAPMLALFFSSMLFHLTTAAFSYFFSMKIVWGATVKEQQNPSSMQAIKQTFQAYWKEYLFLGLIMASYTAACYFYSINYYNAWGLMFYLALQLVGPIVLNPHITSISY